MFDLRTVAAFVLSASCAAGAWAQSRATVVETQLLSPALKAQLQSQLRRAPPAAAQAGPERIAQARALIRASRLDGDPRLLGYAEARIADLDSVDALVLRATIEQSRHRFDAATQLLERALQREPAHAQALLTRATIAQVRGELGSARRDCVALAPQAPAVAAICGAVVDSLTGHDARALASLETIAGRGPPALRGWALSLAGEVHARNGRLAPAVHAYTAALAAEDDLYTRVALADALIELGQAESAEAALGSAPATDAVLLRRWRIALRSGGDALPLARRLEQRLAAAEARGELLHAREASWFALERGATVEAMRYARDNWAVQREPADALLLALAGRAAGDGRALAEVRGWLASTGLRDLRIERALAGAGGA